MDYSIFNTANFIPRIVSKAKTQGAMAGDDHFLFLHKVRRLIIKEFWWH